MPTVTPLACSSSLLNEIARAENWTLRYVPCQWLQCLEQLEQGAHRSDAGRGLLQQAGPALRFPQCIRHQQLVSGLQPSRYQSALPGRPRRQADRHSARRYSTSLFFQLMAGSHYDYQPVLVSSLDQGYAAVVSGQADAAVTNSFFAARSGKQIQICAATRSSSSGRNRVDASHSQCDGNRI